ncbi:MAG: YbhB/YbcL family Raf kinase inhibitor-like protein [Myxococcota bacterium]
MRLELTSPAFSTGGTIPKKHTCEGANTSPALTWTEVPAGTRTLALVVDDPDAPGGTWVHWVAWNIPATARGLPEAVSPTDAMLQQGQNDFRAIGYGGPCPPRGHGPHRYFFRLYALDAPLTLPPTTTRATLDAALAGHVLATAELMGTYLRDR